MSRIIPIEELWEEKKVKPEDMELEMDATSKLKPEDLELDATDEMIEEV